MWIKLTVCGVTRFGYGAADGKQGGDAIKEVIGDALRNAAMRFGAALDLWHKGDLHGDDDPAPMVEPREERKPAPPAEPTPAARRDWLKDTMSKANTAEKLQSWWTGDKIAAAVAALPQEMVHELDAEYCRLFDELRLADTAESVFPSGPDAGDGHEGDGAP